MAKISKSDIKDMLAKAEHLVLTVHVSPDGDAIGSMAALYEYLMGQGKSVTMVVDDEVPSKFRFLSVMAHIKDVSQEASILDGLEQPDLVVVLDASTRERIGKVAAWCQTPILNIDHHISNSQFADYLYLDAEAAATGEILADLFMTWQAKVTPAMANALYLAMGTDSGFFKYSNTTAHTLQMGAYCLEKGAQPDLVSEQAEEITVKALEGMKEALQTVTFHKNGHVACMSVPYALMEKVQGQTDGFIEWIRHVDTVDIAILLKEKEPGQTRVSLRSKGADVNRVAAVFGGGGHIRAAGCSISLPLEEAKKKLLEAI